MVIVQIRPQSCRVGRSFTSASPMLLLSYSGPIFAENVTTQIRVTAFTRRAVRQLPEFDNRSTIGDDRRITLIADSAIFSR